MSNRARYPVSIPALLLAGVFSFLCLFLSSAFRVWLFCSSFKHCCWCTISKCVMNCNLCFLKCTMCVCVFFCMQYLRDRTTGAFSNPFDRGIVHNAMERLFFGIIVRSHKENVPRCISMRVASVFSASVCMRMAYVCMFLSLVCCISNVTLYRAHRSWATQTATRTCRARCCYEDGKLKLTHPTYLHNVVLHCTSTITHENTRAGKRTFCQFRDIERP
jgi:hypothetical protein